MAEQYDVIIAGAGPAGAQCARYLSENSKYSVLLLDRTQEIGEPKKSTAGTRPETFEEFDIPKKVTMCKTPETIFEGPTEQVTLPTKGWHVLEFGRFKKFLVEEAVKHGTKVEIEATVTAPIIEQEKTVGVEYKNLDGVQQARAGIVIDASGPTAVLATQLGLRTLGVHGVGMELEMEQLHLEHQNCMVFRFDHTYAPGGYSWIFSTGHNAAKVGNGWYSTHFKKMGGNGNSHTYLKRWINEDKRLLGGIALEMHAGDGYTDSVSKRSADNFLAIGDSVCAVNPLYGEGIYPALCSATIAAQVAIDALQRHDTSARSLAVYDKQWHERFGSQWKRSNFLATKLYTFENKRFDQLIRNMRKMDTETWERFLHYNLSLKDLIKIFPF